MRKALFSLSEPIRRDAVLECLHFGQLLKVYAFPMHGTHRGGAGCSKRITNYALSNEEHISVHRA